MNDRRLSLAALAIATLAPVGSLLFGTVASTQVLPQPTCTAPATWTSHRTIPAPDASVNRTSNCEFHVWAWQTFLWMTQPDVTGSPRFINFPTVSETFAPEGTSPAVFRTPAGSKVLTLTPRATKSSDPFDSIFQAERRGVLINRDGRSVYFSVNVGDVYYEFIRNKKYYDPVVFENALANETFPIGALEFKYSWRIVADGQDTSKFFVLPVEIHLLVERDGHVVVDPTKTEKVNVALVGVHVVGVVKDHPEFIWATFEHVDNAPDLPGGMLWDSPNAVSDRNWTFYAANTPAIESNRANADVVKLVDPAKQLLTPVTNVFRQYAWGSQESDASNAADIVSLNTSVRKGVLAAEPIWQNYMLVGGTRLAPNSLQPDERPSRRALGSSKLSNATMETFTQVWNCFNCHSTLGVSKDGVTLLGKNLNLSHALTDAYFRAKKARNAASLR